MPPSDVSLKRSKKVPDMVFLSSLRSWLRLTKPMIHLKHRKAAMRLTTSLLPSSPCLGREGQVLGPCSRPSHFILLTVLVSAFHGWRRYETSAKSETKSIL